MLTAQSFEIDKVINVTTYGLVGGQNSFQGTVLGIVSHKTIPSTASPVNTHINIWANLPIEVQNQIENDYKSYQYLALGLAEDIIIYLGLPWINENSVNVVGSRTVVIPLLNFNDVSFTRVRELLTFNGYVVGEITE